MKRAFLLITACLFAAPAHAEGPYDWLAGEWTGKKETTMAGGCVMVSPGGAATGDAPPKPLVQDARIVFEVDEAGSLTGVSYRGEKEGEGMKVEWTGALTSDGAIRVVARLQATCNGNERSYEVVYTGASTRKEDGIRLVLEGTDSPCPEGGCEFKNRFVLTKGNGGD